MGVQLLERARNAQRLFERQQARERPRLLDFVQSNGTWDDGEVGATFRQPFDLLAETTAIAARLAADGGPNSARSEGWLGDQDSNLDCSVQSQRTKPGLGAWFDDQQQSYHTPGP